jgi:hypothetical protein
MQEANRRTDMANFTTGRRIIMTALAVSLMAVATASAGPARVYVRVKPPAARVDVRGVAPSRSHVWVGGFHRWTGSSFVWVAGSWMLPPRPHAVWVPGHWEQTPRGHFWVEGHWR